jgi:peptide/nickel transport system permease protein
MSVNLLGDGVRDALDPRLRSGALSRPAAATRVERTDVPTAPAGDGQQPLMAIDQLRTEFQVGEKVY